MAVVNKNDANKTRICVIGAGAAGLCAVRHMSDDLQSFEPSIFERDSVIGGSWTYNEKIGVDDNGIPIHTSMYKNLRTNFPLKLNTFPDFQTINQSYPSCGTREQVLDYLNDYADHFNIRQFIKFNALVEDVKPVKFSDDTSTLWKVTWRNLKTNIIEEAEFEGIMICNGHYAVPKIPVIPNIETFPGDILHSHDYRFPQRYSGKVVIILGIGPSAIDIGCLISKYAEKVYLSHDNPDNAYGFPSNVVQVFGIKSVDNNKFLLNDGEVVTADSLLYCTGYLYEFPFLDETCGIKIDDDYVHPLYKHIINIEHPTMCFIALLSQTITFPLAHIQVQFYLNFLRGKIELPKKEIMLEECSNDKIRKYPHILNELQWEYNNNLAEYGKFDKLPEFYENGFKNWLIETRKDYMKSRNSEITIEEDGKSVNFKYHD